MAARLGNQAVVGEETCFAFSLHNCSNLAVVLGLSWDRKKASVVRKDQWQ